ncbi:hypothetical protein Tco_0086773 [Tanacetum coccineum]
MWRDVLSPLMLPSLLIHGALSACLCLSYSCRGDLDLSRLKPSEELAFAEKNSSRENLPADEVLRSPVGVVFVLPCEPSRSGSLVRQGSTCNRVCGRECPSAVRVCPRRCNGRGFKRYSRASLEYPERDPVRLSSPAICCLGLGLFCVILN